MNQPPSVSSLESHLGYWLRFVSNHVSHAFSRKLEARKVTVAEWVLLRELFDQEAVIPSQLATQLGMTRGAISKLTDKLLAKALITRTIDERDRRYQFVALTSTGRALVPELAALADANDAEFFNHLDPSERVIIERAMKEIVRYHDLKSIPIE